MDNKKSTRLEYFITHMSNDVIYPTIIYVLFMSSVGGREIYPKNKKKQKESISTKKNKDRRLIAFLRNKST